MKDAWFSLLSEIGPANSLDAAFVVKRTGAMEAAWARVPVPEDIVSVMAAALVGSTQTLLESLGGPSPQSVLVETETHRLLITQLDGGSFLLVIASSSLDSESLRQAARNFASRLEPGKPSGPRKSSPRSRKP